MVPPSTVPLWAGMPYPGPGAAPDDRSFCTTISTGDVDGDGDDDAVFGMPCADPKGLSSGGGLVVLDVE